MPGGTLAIEVDEEFLVRMTGPVGKVAEGRLDDEVLGCRNDSIAAVRGIQYRAAPHVRLRPTTTADLEFVLAAESAAENRAFILQWPRDQHIAAIESPASAHRIVEDVSSGEAVGYVILSGLDSIHRSIEFRRVVVTAKGRGYGRAAVRMIKTFAFEELAAHRLWLDVKEFNQRARRLYESEGFTVEGRLRECYRGEIGFESVYVMSILESEYCRVAK
jgi:RimJ/RimL family protein N-acetyltransferase